MADRPDNADETAILATYPTRRDAEVAREYLADANIPAFVSADDGGGVYPQMQRSNGVKLMGMGKTVPGARERLEEGGLLPEVPAPSTTAADTFGPALYTLAVALGVIAVGLVLLMVVLG